MKILKKNIVMLYGKKLCTFVLPKDSTFDSFFKRNMHEYITEEILDFMSNYRLGTFYTNFFTLHYIIESIKKFN